MLQSVACLTNPAVEAQQMQQPAWQSAWAPLQGMVEAMQGSMQNAWQGMSQAQGGAASWFEPWQQMMANAMPAMPDFTKIMTGQR